MKYMPRQEKGHLHAWILLVSFLLIPLCGVAQTRIPGQPASLPPAISQQMQQAVTNQQYTPQAVQSSIQQMDQLIRTGVGDASRIQPTFDGKNLIFRINGQVYTFDVTQEAHKVTENLTTLTVTPEVPRAYEEATIRVTNYSTNLAEDRITWTVNGSVVQDQIGGTSITIPMRGIGEETRVVVSVMSRKLGEFFSKELLVNPGDVAILWEANTYTPPFYKGKPLPSYKSTVKLIPFPTLVSKGKNISPDQLLYEWKRNYRNVEALSGFGKRSASFETGGGLQEERLKLLVRDPNSGAQTEREVTIAITEPKLLLYAGSPLFGFRYEEALGKSFLLSNEETTIKGEPYFASKEELEDGSAPLKWSQNGKSIPSLNQSVTLHKPTTGGSSRIDASIDNPKRILQSAKSSITITYQ